MEVELERFRRAWREELKQRAEHAQASGSSQQTSNAHTAADPAPPSVSPSVSKPKLVSALDFYSLAVEREREGLLDEALSLYRAAFRKDSNVNLAYEHFLSEEISKLHLESKPKPSRESDVKDRDARSPTAIRAAAGVENPVASTLRLHDVLANFPAELAFEAEDEEQVVPLTTVPDEVLLRILLLLDPTTVERFASVSRKARVLSLDSSYWRYTTIHLSLYRHLNQPI